MASVIRCRFERHPQCRHDDLFHGSYQRTNRTKGSKILRCFPHCCPQHVARSFCGASLLVRVDATGLVAGNDDDGSDSDDAAMNLFVVARFRLRTAPRLSVGERLLQSDIQRSLQSEDEPNNVWVASRGVHCGPRRGDWRFELKESARWFYGWESGVAKAHRLQEHVLEVVVCSLETQRQPQNTRPPRAQIQPDTLLVVRATLESPPFKLISFRRATPQAMHALSVASASPKSLLVQDDVPRSRTVYPSKPALKRWRDHTVQAWRTSVVNADLDEDVDATRAPEDTDAATTSMLLKRPRIIDGIKSGGGGGSAGVAAVRLRSAPISDRFACSSLDATMDNVLVDFTLLWIVLERLSVTDLMRHSDGVLLQHLDVGVSALGSRVNIAAWLTRVHSLQPRRQSFAFEPSPSILHLVVELAAWLALDAELHTLLFARLLDATLVLLRGDRRALFERHFAPLLSWICARASAFLATRTRFHGHRHHIQNLTLDGLFNELRRQWPTLWARCKLSSAATRRQVAFRMFVAQVRQVAADEAKRDHHNLVYRRIPRGVHCFKTTTTARDRRWSGTWRCRPHSFVLERDALSLSSCSSSASMPSTAASLSLSTALFAWRQWSEVQLSLWTSGDGCDPPQLHLRSLWSPTWSVTADNDNETEATGTRLVLDSRPRWFARFPAGESTLAVQCGGHSWGDYVGSMVRSDQIDLRLFAWDDAAAADDDDGGVRRESVDAVRWRVRLQLREQQQQHEELHARETSTSVVVVSVVVHRARLSTAADVASTGFGSIEALRSALRTATFVDKARWLNTHWRIDSQMAWEMTKWSIR